MGFSLPRKLKDNFLTRGASRAFDQVNMFDNNRTWQQRTPTQTKSTFQQVGQLGGQTARAVGGGTARVLNTVGAAISEVPATVRGEVAMRTGNQKALSNALTAQRNMRNQLYSTQNQGLLGRGTVFKSPEERLTASPADVIKKVGGAVAESGLELASAGMGGVAGKTIARQGIKQGIKSQLPTIAKNAALNTAQGGVTAYNQGASGKDILKSAAIGGTVGTVADVGLGLAGAGASKAAKSQIKPVYALEPEPKPKVSLKSDPLESLKQEARKYKSAEEFTQAIQDGKVSIPKGSPEQIAAIQKQLGMNWDEAYKTPTGVYDMQKKVANDLYNQATAPQVGKTPEKYPGLVDEILNASSAREAEYAAKQRGIDLQLSDSVLSVMKKDRDAATDMVNGYWTKQDFRNNYKQSNKSLFETVEEIGGGNGDIQNPYFMNYGNYGEKTGRNITVEFPKNKDGGDIRILDADDGELKTIPYDTAVKMYGTTDQKILANKVVNGKQATTTAPQVGKTDPLEALKAEARKYRSADEFVKAQGEPLYHGTRDTFDTFDLEKTGQGGFSNHAPGINMTTSKKGASEYANYKRDYLSDNFVRDDAGIVMERWIKPKNTLDTVANPNLKIKDVISQEQFSQMIKQAPDQGRLRKMLENRVYGDDVKSLSDKELIKRLYKQHMDSSVIGDGSYSGISKLFSDLSFPYMSSKSSMVNNFRKITGIDSMAFPMKNGADKVVVSFDPNNLLSKQQLTDLYNQATQSQPPKSTATVEKNLAPSPAVKPKAELKTPDQIKAAQKKTLESIAEKPKVSIKKPIIPARTTDDAIREIAGLGGLDIGQSKIELGAANKLISAATGGNFTNVRGANIARTLADKAGERINKATEANITGTGAPVANKARAIFAGTGLADETKQIARVRHGQYANIKDVVTRLNEKDVAIQAKYGDKAQEMLDRVMRDEDYTKRVYGTTPNKLNTLPEDLQALVKEKMNMNKVVNDLNYETGVIDAGTWKQGTKGEHIGRIFAIPKAEKNFMRESLNSMFEAQAGISRKDITKMSDEVIALLERDPIRAINLRMELALRNKAITEAMDGMAARKFIQATPPNKNFVQMNGKRYGAYNGQWIERGMLEELTGNRIFDGGMADSLDRFINAYKGSLLGKSDRLQKAFKTTLSPGTIVGNISSNPIMFNPGAGTNPLTQTYDMLKAASKLSKGVSDADVYAARQLGVIGGDTGKLLTGSSSETLAMGKNSGNIVRRGLEKTMSKFGQFYGSIDDAAKLGLWTRLQKQGLDPQKAALEVAKFTQDYNNVGRVVTLIADTPVLGKPFARFSPELIRIIKNNATRAPHRMIAGVAALAYIANKLSKDSGESEEERKAREGQVGQTRIPGTSWINELVGGPSEDVSLNLPFGDSAVNVARAVGLNFPMEPGVDPNRALLEQLLPVEIPTSKNSLGEDVFDPTKVVTSMTLKPLIEQVFDKNFMGNPVSDPTNRSYDSQGQEKKYTELPQNEQIKNRLRSAAVSLLPLGSEADSLISAATGNENVLGKERTLPQAIARTFGIKAENNDKQTREDRVGTAEYFDTDKVREQNFLKENPDLEQLYFDIFPKTKDRVTGRKESDQITPERWAKINAESSGRIFEFMKQEALEKNKSTDGKYPVDPVFKLPTKQQEKIVSELRSRPTGEDIESEEILRATQSWYPEFEKAERDYYDKSGAYYDSLGLPDTQNERAKAYANIPFAEQPPLVKDYYALKATDPEAAKAMFKSTNLSDEFDKYSLDRLRYINEKRKIEGYPPIDATTFNNVTFGYEDDESAVFNELKYGKSYGGYGSGGSSGVSFKKSTVPSAKSLEKVSLKSSTPEIRTKKSVKRRARPKIQLKKSMV